MAYFAIFLEVLGVFYIQITPNWICRTVISCFNGFLKKIENGAFLVPRKSIFRDFSLFDPIFALISVH